MLKKRIELEKKRCHKSRLKKKEAKAPVRPKKREVSHAMPFL